MPDVVALGEILIDFSPVQKSVRGNSVFEANPGGAPANVLALLSKLGVSTAFIGKAGDDLFGHSLKKTLEGLGIGTQGLILSAQYNTTLAFVDLDASGDRSFAFVRNYGADKMLAPSDVNLPLLRDAAIFHFGGVTLTDEPSRTATLETARRAKALGAVVTFDPNFRAPLFKSAAAFSALRQGLTLADIAKVSQEECFLLSDVAPERGLRAAAGELAARYRIPLLFVTRGPDGSAFLFDGQWREQDTFAVKTIDTTGAGDAFFGGVLARFLQTGKPLSQLESDEAEAFARFGNAAGALVTTRSGALLSMPNREEIDALLRTR